MAPTCSGVIIVPKRYLSRMAGVDTFIGILKGILHSLTTDEPQPCPVLLFFDGFQEDPRELFEVAEVVTFCSTVLAKAPGILPALIHEDDEQFVNWFPDASDRYRIVGGQLLLVALAHPEIWRIDLSLEKPVGRDIVANKLALEFYLKAARSKMD